MEKKHPEKKTFLISATYQDVIEKISDHLKCFDGCYGTSNENLKSEIKLKKIKDLTLGQDFEYIGDSFADLVIWDNAQKSYLVNPSKSLLRAVKKNNNLIEVIILEKRNIISEIIKTIRVHQ